LVYCDLWYFYRIIIFYTCYQQRRWCHKTPGTKIITCDQHGTSQDRNFFSFWRLGKMANSCGSRCPHMSRAGGFVVLQQVKARWQLVTIFRKTESRIEWQRKGHFPKTDLGICQTNHWQGCTSSLFRIYLFLGLSFKYPCRV